MEVSRKESKRKESSDLAEISHLPLKKKGRTTTNESNLRHEASSTSVVDAEKENEPTIDSGKPWWVIGQKSSRGNKKPRSVSDASSSGIKIAFTGFETIDERETLASVAACVEKRYMGMKMLENPRELSEVSSNICMLSPNQDLDVLFPCSIVVKSANDMRYSKMLLFFY